MQDRRRTPVVFDVETAPDMEWIERSRDLFVGQLESPGNYKDRHKIQGWMQAKVDDRVGRAALSPIDGKLTAFAVASLWGDDQPEAVVLRGDEPELITRLILDLGEASNGGDPILAGFYINQFDIPFVTARAAVHEIRLPKWWPVHPRRYGATIDAAEILDEGKLATWLARFNLPAKLGDGKHAPDMPDDKLLEYVRQDVVVERALLRRLALVSPEIAATEPSSANANQ